MRSAILEGFTTGAPTSMHLYTYCENDPINHTDPTGHYKSMLKNII